VNNYKDKIKIKPNEFKKKYINAPELLADGSITLKYDIWCCGWLLYNMCELKDTYDEVQTVANFKKWTKPVILNTIPELVDIFKR
jgi:hypothetical protein